MSLLISVRIEVSDGAASRGFDRDSTALELNNSTKSHKSVQDNGVK